MAKKTSTALALVPTTVTDVTPVGEVTFVAPTLATLAGTIKEALLEMEGATFDYLQAAIKLGTAAIQAKEQLPKGEFLPWIEKHCSKSQPWVAQCMNAARTEQLLGEKSQREAARLREGANSIEAFAALYKPLKAGDADPLNPTTKPVTRQRKVGKTTTTLDNNVQDADILDMPPAREANIKADLDAQRKELDERERKLILRESDCAERERKLDEREEELKEREWKLVEREKVQAAGSDAAEAAQDGPILPDGEPEAKVEVPAEEPQAGDDLATWNAKTKKTSVRKPKAKAPKQEPGKAPWDQPQVGVSSV